MSNRSANDEHSKRLHRRLARAAYPFSFARRLGLVTGEVGSDIAIAAGVETCITAVALTTSARQDRRGAQVVYIVRRHFVAILADVVMTILIKRGA